MKFSYVLLKKLLPALPAKKKLGEALNLHAFETASLDGDLLDISLPSNRYSDAASHIGIAREAAAITGHTLKNPEVVIINPPAKQGIIKVKVENQKLCPRYAARYFEIKKIEKSPVWLEKILKTCGVNPINNVVDLMNYVMLETGQPLHAFDFDKLESVKSKISTKGGSASGGKNQKSKLIIVRRAKKGEAIQTLDGQRVTLDSQMLVIADKKKALAIAGIKGGAHSGVSAKTKRIIVEAANFDPVSIFKTSKKLKLSTDAALRFSHYISPELVGLGMDRVTVLLKKTGAVLKDSVDIYPRPLKSEIIEFDFSQYANLIGASVSKEKAKNYFRRLGFEIKPRATHSTRSGQEESFLVVIPPWRTDIQNFEDLAEEVSRLEGYEKLRPQPALVSLTPTHQDNTIIFKDKIRTVLRGFQLDEVYGYSFTSEKEAPKKNLFGWAPIALENPMSNERAYLRPDLFAGIREMLLSNTRFYERIGIFEIGNIFGAARGKAKERLMVGIGMAQKKNPKIILELKGAVDEFLKSVGLVDFFLREIGGELRIESGHAVVGFVKSVRGFKEKWDAAVSEIDGDTLLELVEEGKEFEALPKYPSIMRDISILVGQDVRIGEILETIQEVSPNLIADVDLIDEYTDEKFGGKQSLTFRIVFQAEDRTLTDQEVDKEFSRITTILRKRFSADIR